MSLPRWAAVTGTVLACLGACTPSAPPPLDDPRVAQFAKLPDWRGYWIAEGMKADISGYTAGGPTAPMKMAFEGRDAPWKPEQLKKIQAMLPTVLEGVAKGKSTGWGYPMMMQSFAPLQFLITPEETLVINFYRDVRHVHTDGRPHPAPDDLWPTPWGDSIGHWEGDTLIIETTAVKGGSILFIPIPFVSGNARYTERLRRTAQDRIESQFTIEDPDTLTGPWTFKLAYVRQPGLDRMVHEDFSNDRVEVDKDGDLLTITPPKH
jgi:hypothetical protein